MLKSFVEICANLQFCIKIGSQTHIETTWTHSFFGQLYYYPTGSNDPIAHPDSPNPNPNA